MMKISELLFEEIESYKKNIYTYELRDEYIIFSDEFCVKYMNKLESVLKKQYQSISERECINSFYIVKQFGYKYLNEYLLNSILHLYYADYMQRIPKLINYKCETIHLKNLLECESSRNRSVYLFSEKMSDSQLECISRNEYVFESYSYYGFCLSKNAKIDLSILAGGVEKVNLITYLDYFIINNISASIWECLLESKISITSDCLEATYRELSDASFRRNMAIYKFRSSGEKNESYLESMYKEEQDLLCKWREDRQRDINKYIHSVMGDTATLEDYINAIKEKISNDKWYIAYIASMNRRYSQWFQSYSEDRQRVLVKLEENERKREEREKREREREERKREREEQRVARSELKKRRTVEKNSDRESIFTKREKKEILNNLPRALDMDPILEAYAVSDQAMEILQEETAISRKYITLECPFCKHKLTGYVCDFVNKKPKCVMCNDRYDDDDDDDDDNERSSRIIYFAR